MILAILAIALAGCGAFLIWSALAGTSYTPALPFGLVLIAAAILLVAWPIRRLVTGNAKRKDSL